LASVHAGVTLIDLGMNNLFSALLFAVSELVEGSELALLEVISVEAVTHEKVARLSSVGRNHGFVVVGVFFLSLKDKFVKNLN
jgi:hypothetical protein